MTTRYRRSSTGRCFGCDYPLAQTGSRRCPECGREYDPADRRTFNTAGKPVGRGARWLAGVWAWPVVVAAVGVFLMQLWCERMPGHPRLDQIESLKWCWTGVVLAWVALQFVAPHLTSGLPADLRPARRRWLWIAPAVLALAIVASHYDWGFYLSFALSRPALSRFVAEADAEYPKTDWKPRSVGLFDVSEIIAAPRLVVLRINGQCFIHAPDGVPGWADGSMWNEGRATPLPAKDWYLTTFSSSSAGPQATQEIYRDLLLHPDRRPYAIDFLISSLIQVHPKEPFGFLGGEVGDRFIYSSEDGSENIRPDVQAITRLGAQAVGPLANALTAGKYPLNILGALGILGPAAAPAILQVAPLLQSHDPQVREAAAWALGQVGPAAISQEGALLPLLNDPDPCVQVNARFALMALKPDMIAFAPNLVAVWHGLIAYGQTPSIWHSFVYETLSANRTYVVDQLRRAGPAVAAVAPRIAAEIVAAQKYLRDNPPRPYTVNIPTQQDEGYDFARSLRRLTIIDGAHLLGAMGSAARNQAPLLRSFFTNHPEKDLNADMDNAIALALHQIAPNDPTTLGVLLGVLAQSRQEAMETTADEGFLWVRKPAYYNSLDLGRLMQTYDPGNATVRQILGDDLRADVNAPQRAWAAGMCRAIAPPPAGLRDALTEMLENGDDRAYGYAAGCVPAVPMKDRPPAGAIIAWIEAHERDPRVGQNIPFHRCWLLVALLPDLDPESTDVVRFLMKLQARGEYRKAVADAMPRTQAAAPLLATAELPRLREQLRDPHGDPSRTDVLSQLQVLGPAAAPALPDLLPLLWENPISNYPREGATYVLANIGWNGQIAAAMRKLIGGNDSRAAWETAQLAPKFGPPILPILLQYGATLQPDGAREAAAVSVMELAAKTPTPIAQLQPFFRFAQNTDAVRAIVHSSDPPPTKAGALLAFLSDDECPVDTQAAAAQALIALGTATPEIHDVLFSRGWESGSLSVRHACFAAMDALFPGHK